jgi:hypothetical protein
VDAAKIIRTLKEGLGPILAEKGAALTGEYPVRPAPAKPHAAQATVGIGQLGDTLDIRLMITAPFEEGGARCEALCSAIQSGVESLEIDGYQGMQRKGLGYEPRNRTCTLELSLRFRPMLQVQFEEIQIPCYAETLRVAGERMLKTYYAPMVGEVVQNLGLRARIISGQGEFRGNERQERFDEISELFRETEQGTLTLPDGQSMEAVFSKLVSSASHDCIRYECCFTEVPPV